MGRKRARNVVGSAPGNAEDREQDGAVESPTIWVKPYSTDAYVLVYRRNDLTQGWEVHGRLDPRDAEPDTIAARFGGGKYKLQLKDKDESGSMDIRETHQIQIPGVYRPPRELPGLTPDPVAAPKAEVGTLPAGEGKTGTSDILSAGILQLFQSMQQANDMNNKILTAALADRNTGPRTDWGELLRVVAPGLFALLTAILTREKDEGKDPLELARDLVTMMQQSQPKQSPMAEAVAAVKDLIAAKDMLDSPAAEPADPLTATLPKLAEILLTEQNRRQGPRTGSPAGPVAPAPLQLVKEGPMPPTPPVPGPAWKQLLQVHGGRLLEEAAIDRDPAFLAELIVTYSGPADHQALVELLSLPDGEAQLVQMVPGLGAYNAWRTELCQALRIELGMIPDPDATPEDEAEGQEDKP